MFLPEFDKPISKLLADIPYIQGECHLKEDRNFSSEEYYHIHSLLIPALEQAGYHNFHETFVDGLHILFDEGRILIRKSGTTPIM